MLRAVGSQNSLQLRSSSSPHISTWALPTPPVLSQGETDPRATSAAVGFAHDVAEPALPGSGGFQSLFVHWFRADPAVLVPVSAFTDDRIVLFLPDPFHSLWGSTVIFTASLDSSAVYAEKGKAGYRWLLSGASLGDNS